MHTRMLWITLCLGGAWPGSPLPVRAGLDEALHVLRAVDREGRGNAEASAAWREVVGADAAQLPQVLRALDGANPLAANWLRTAIETIAERTLDKGGALPWRELGQFLFETQHDHRARYLAYELIARGDPGTAERLLPGLVNDPGNDLRRDAVQRLIDQAAEILARGNKPGAALLYRQAVDFARDARQIEGVAAKLKDLGQPVDLVRTLGFLTEWRVIGPFDNTDRAGFDRAFPPESELKLGSEYDGKLGKVRWQAATTTNEYGMLDINQSCGKLKEATAYAYTEFNADQARSAELRLGCKNAWKVWFNGRLLFGRDEYHAGSEIDQYRLPVQLEPGRNTILIKVCQNEEKEEWTVEWEFQLRICDALGTPIRPAGPPAATTAEPVPPDRSLLRTARLRNTGPGTSTPNASHASH